MKSTRGVPLTRALGVAAVEAPAISTRGSDMNAVTDSAKYAVTRDSQSEPEARQETSSRDYRDALDSATLSLERIETALEVLHKEDGEDVAHTMTLSYWALQERATVRKGVREAYFKGVKAVAWVLPRETDPDAELKALVTAQAASEKEIHRLIAEAEKQEGPSAHERHPQDKAFYEAVERHERKLWHQIMETLATTLAGVSAKLRCAFFGQALSPGINTDEHNKEMLASVLVDIGRLEALSTPRVSGADAGAARAGTSASAADADPDARLKELAAAWWAADEKQHRIAREAEEREGPSAFEKHPRYKDVYTAAERHAEVLWKQIEATSATTFEGVLARLRCAFFGQDLSKDLNAGHVCEELLAACMADLDRMVRSSR